MFTVCKSSRYFSGNKFTYVSRVQVKGNYTSYMYVYTLYYPIDHCQIR